MKRYLSFGVLLAATLHHGHCQALARRAFEVASITPCEPGTPEPGGERMGMVRFTFPGGRFHAQATSVKFLLEWSYGILDSQHSSGPAWLDNQRYDIEAKADGDATMAQMKQMVQTMLADRFHLKFHRETKDVPVVVISLGKTAPKLFPPKDDEKYAIRIEPQTGPDDKVIAWHVTATRFSFAQLNETFSRQLGRVIVNHTGMDGDFDWSLEFRPDESRPNPLDPDNIMEALRSQLGLVVKSEKAPIDYFVIDSAEKVAAGN